MPGTRAAPVEEPLPPSDPTVGKPPGLTSPRCELEAVKEAFSMMHGVPERSARGEKEQPCESLRSGMSDAFVAPNAPAGLSGGFPNPWLWPTDAAVGGSGLPPSLQSAAAPHPHDQPMKIPIFGGGRASDKSAAAELAAAQAAPPDPEDDGEDLSCHWHMAAASLAVSDDDPELAKGDGGDFGPCRWHRSAETVGVISEDGHVFTKTAGPRRSRFSDRGARVELASICMVFDSSLRCGGVHRYCYQIMGGELGAADGAGFVFDSKVRRNNIQRMRSVFLNQRGRICLRNNQQVTKLQQQLPPLTVGVCLTLLIDLDSLMARFNVSNSQGVLGGSADVSLDGLFDTDLGNGQLRSGFFCAVVTGSITIGIH